MLWTRWKMMAGVLSVSLGGLATVAGQCPKNDANKSQKIPGEMFISADNPTLPQMPPPAPPSPAPSPVVIPPSAAPATPAPAVLPAASMIPAIPASPAMPPPGVMHGVPAPNVMPHGSSIEGFIIPQPPSASVPPAPAPSDATKKPEHAQVPVPSTGPMIPTAGPSVPPVASAIEPTVPALGSPATLVPQKIVGELPATPPALPNMRPTASSSGSPEVGNLPQLVAPSVVNSGAMTPPAAQKTPAPIVAAAAVSFPSNRFRIVLRVGENEPSFEVRSGDDLVLKVVCEKVDVKSPEKGTGLSTVKAAGKVHFVGFGAEGSCDELAFLAGTGEVSMTGNVKIQVKDKLGRVESELSTENVKYKIDASAMSGSLKP